MILKLDVTCRKSKRLLEVSGQAVELVGQLPRVKFE